MQTWNNSQKWRQAVWLCLIVVALSVVPFTEGKVKIWSAAINPSVKEDYVEEIKVKYNILTSRQMAPSEVLKYIEADFKSLSPSEKTKLMYRFERYMHHQIPSFDEKLFYHGNHKMIYKYFYYAYQPEKIMSIEEEPFKRTMIELDHSGYVLKRIKNMYHPSINYSFLINTFKGMSDEGLEYLELQQLYEIVKDSKIQERHLNVKNVENLLSKCDYFINRFPLSEKTQEIQTILTTKLWDYIYGNKEFESFDYFTGQVDESLLNSYLRLGEHLYDKNLGNVLQNYSKMVKRNGGVVINDFLKYASLGIQRNRQDDIYASIDRVTLINRYESFAGSDQFIPELNGFSDVDVQKKINEKLSENIHKYVFVGWNRGYRMDVQNLDSSYSITHNREGVFSLYQTIDITYTGSKPVRYYECFNFDFDKKKTLTLTDCFLNYDSQKSKIKEFLDKEVQTQKLGPFERVETYEVGNINNFVITNDGIEVFLRIIDESGRLVNTADIELSYSDFSTIIRPDFKL